MFLIHKGFYVWILTVGHNTHKNLRIQNFAGIWVDDVRRIAGRHSRDIEAVLGYNYGGSVVHRDDLVLP